MQGSVSNLKRECHSHKFIVETTNTKAAEFLSAIFTEAQLTEKDTLVFSGDTSEMFQVLSVITKHKHKIPISKIECAESSLESLFMEVISK